jgi:hypothetical protein
MDAVGPGNEAVCSSETLTATYHTAQYQNAHGVMGTMVMCLHGSRICILCYVLYDRLCGLLIGVPGCRSRGPGFDFRRYHIF